MVAIQCGAGKLLNRFHRETPINPEKRIVRSVHRLGRERVRYKYFTLYQDPKGFLTRLARLIARLSCQTWRGFTKETFRVCVFKGGFGEGCHALADSLEKLLDNLTNLHILKIASSTMCRKRSFVALLGDECI